MTNIIVWDISAEINKDYTITQLRWSRSTLVLFQRRICTAGCWTGELQSNRMTAICIIRYSDWIIYQCHFLIRYRFKYHARYFLSQINGEIIPTDFLLPYRHNQGQVDLTSWCCLRSSSCLLPIFSNLSLTDEENQSLADAFNFSAWLFIRVLCYT